MPTESIHDDLARSRLAPDLLAVLFTEQGVTAVPQDVIIELNAEYPGGPRMARLALIDLFVTSTVVAPDQVANARAGLAAMGLSPTPAGPAAWPISAAGGAVAFNVQDELGVWKSLQTEAFLFAKLLPTTLFALAAAEASDPTSSRATAPLVKTPSAYPLVHKIWLDHVVNTLVYESVRTIKGDAARQAFGSAGLGVVWAVADTGVDAKHPHFATHDTLKLPGGLRHCDFTASHATPEDAEAAAIVDGAGHGTHVAGIIAGGCYTQDSSSLKSGVDPVKAITVKHTVRKDDNSTDQQEEGDRAEVTGIAPLCKIVSLKVLVDDRSGQVSNLLAAIGYIQQLNNYGRDIKIHGLNLSLGYPFDAAWFAAGQSPLCTEVDRLTRCGVVVVAAAGNAGYGRVSAFTGASAAAALPCTIADPGNADLAITVGSTHRSRPHVFGVSYFSAKGPTADGRLKPDLVAPGERIVSCEAGAEGQAFYKEDSGTSMAAPHVSAAIAAFLSVRSEFIGRPQEVKAIFVESAMDLKRRPEFQGAGLVDLMKALQSV